MEADGPPDDAQETQRAGVLLYRRGNGFEFLMLQRSSDTTWELPSGPMDARQDDTRLVALRNTHLSAGVWPDCFLMHRDFVRVNSHVENGLRVRETFYLAEISTKTTAGDAIDSDTLPKLSELHCTFQWMSADVAKVRIKTDHGRLLLGQATDFLESQDQMENVFSVLSSIK